MNRVLRLRVSALPEAVIKGVKLLSHAHQLHALLHGGIQRAKARRLRLERFADNAAPPNLFRLRNADAGSGAWAALQKPVVFELPKGLRDRQKAHAEFLS